MAELFFSFSNLDLIRNKNIDVINNKNLTNTHLIGSVMYTEYFLYSNYLVAFYWLLWLEQLCLHLEEEKGLEQDISKQVDRKKKDSIELIKLKMTMPINPTYFTLLSALLFSIGMLGIFLIEEV